MNFYIRKNSTLPKISVEVFTDSNDSFRNNYDSFSSSTITFNLIDENTNIYKYIGIPVVVKEKPSNGDGPTQYYLETQLNKGQTKKTGSYIGEFIIEDDKGKTILPINNKLKVFVIDSFSNSDLCCRTNRNEEVIFPTETARPTQTPTPTLTLTNTPTQTQTLTSTPTPTLTQTLTPTQTTTTTAGLTSTQTPTQTQTLTSTPSPTITLTNTPSSPETFFILFEDGNIMTSENGDGIEYEH